jgi:hypothetical protein
MLGGEGGDELFELSPLLLADRIRSRHPLSALAMTRQVPGGDRQPLGRLARFAARYAALGWAPAAMLRRTRRPADVWAEEPRWLDPLLARDHAERHDPLRWRDLSAPRWWAYRAYILTTGREALGFADEVRRGWHHDRIRVEQPMLDLDLVELVLGLPPELAFSSSFDRPVLREAVSGLLPERVRQRTGKSNFMPVLAAQLASEDVAAAHTLLLGTDARIAAYTDAEGLASLLGGDRQIHADGPAHWTADVWRLLTAECWLRSLDDLSSLARTLHSAAPARTSFHLEAAS